MDAYFTANNNIRSHHTDVLKLRVVNHKYAAQIAAHEPLNAPRASSFGSTP